MIQQEFYVTLQILTEEIKVQQYNFQGLVDYEGDSDEEDEDSELSPSPKRQRLSQQAKLAENKTFVIFNYYYHFIDLLRVKTNLSPHFQKKHRLSFLAKKKRNGHNNKCF